MSKPYQAYLVAWYINIEARCPEEAVKIARGIQLDPENIATFFTVWPLCGDKPSTAKGWVIDYDLVKDRDFDRDDDEQEAEHDTECR